MNVASDILSRLTIFMKYSKFVPSKGRRETWTELVDRNKWMHLKKYPKLSKEIEEAYTFVYERQILPSMRSLQFAGKPIELNPTRIYNCSFLPMDHPDCFSEVMFLLLSGTGVGYSVQRHHIKKLPEIRFPKRSHRVLVADSLEGWADAVKSLIDSYFHGKSLPVFDFSDIRPRGAPLKTSGGIAPGPEPLKICLNNIKNILDRKQNGDQLTPLEIHDINCYIADAVLAGGIRRSAMISLFDMDDDEMFSCKSNLHLPKVGESVQYDEKNDTYQFYVEYRGERKSITLVNGAYEEYLKTNSLPWYFVAPERGRSNNSATILRHKIDKKTFLELWKKIEESNSGEPGIFFTNDKDWGLNPCAEISLRPYQFCNLVTINASDIVSQEDLEARAKAASFIATLQAGYTNFHYLRDIWQETTEKEALIGVSMTGIASGTVLKMNLQNAAEIVKKENERVAKIIGINKAARTTTVKPEGTSSLVVGSSSGIHAWHNDFYIRRMRVMKNEPIYIYLNKHHSELLVDDHFIPDIQAVLEIPQMSPQDAITRHESALDLLLRVSFVWQNWVKVGHRKGSNINNVSTTVSIKPDEWDEVGDWMWKHREEFTALACLPHDGGNYIQAPFEDISEKEYEKRMKTLKEIDLSAIKESKDETKLQDELACAGGGCEVV